MSYEPSQDTLEALEVLREAVAKALERKRRLGQYAVIWEDGQLVYLGGKPGDNGQVREDSADYGEREG